MHYLEVSLELSKKFDYPITATTVKTQLMAAVKQLLGTKGTSYKVDILKYNSINQSFVLRCDSEHYVRLRAALTLASTFEGVPCIYNVHRASSNLLNFTANSRTTIMPTVKKYGKDTIIFVTKEDQANPSAIVLPEPEPRPGLFFPNGEINWDCPCLGGMASGPCGIEFRQSFTCFQKSETEPKGSDCLEMFQEMQTCMANYPSVYSKEAYLDDEIEDEEFEMEKDKPIMDDKNFKIGDKPNNPNVINSNKGVEIVKP